MLYFLKKKKKIILIEINKQNINLKTINLKFAELDFTKIIILSVHLKIGAKPSYIKKKSNYPYSPKKVHFGSLIFLVNLIFRPENALAERAVQNNQSIRTNKTGR